MYVRGPRLAHAILSRVPLRPPVALMAASIVLLAGCGGCGGEKQSASAPTAGSASEPAVKAARGASLKRIGTFSSPVYVTAPPADTHRLFVVEQAGRIRVVKDGHKLSA